MRKNHPRKNWYVDVSVLNETEEMEEFREEDCSVETMHSGGKGGQKIKNNATTEAWSKHTEIVRGNPVRVYEGEYFKRKK